MRCKIPPAWTGMMPLAIANGGLRDLLYKSSMAGRVWILIPLWVLVGPVLFRRRK